MSSDSQPPVTDREKAKAPNSRGPLKLFYSYSHEDAALLEGLRKHLASLRHEQVVEDWYDRELTPGVAWDTEISQRLESADIVIVLLSADFVASDYAYGRELRRALELQSQGNLAVVPVMARPCVLGKLPIADLQALPDDAKPITQWDDRDAAYVSVVRGVVEVARSLVAGKRSLADDWLEYRLVRRRVIQQVQEHLTTLGYYQGPPDGIPGRETERAILDFQSASGIDVDGQIGPVTIRQLEAELIGFDPPTPSVGLSARRRGTS